jgi:DNA-binding MarR family transcriptional regulator
LTTKHFLFSVAINKLFDRSPSLKEVATVLNTSHQNAKQIAILLERKGFVVMEEDPEDRRVMRLKETEKNRLYWESMAQEHERFLLGLFSPFSEEDINVFDSHFDRLLSSLTFNNMK